MSLTDIKSDSVDEKQKDELSSVHAVPIFPSDQPRLKSRFWGWRRNEIDLDAVATQPSVYDDSVEAKFYQPHPHYENLHRFDPSARWTWREEKAVVRKIDWKIMTWVRIT